MERLHQVKAELREQVIARAQDESRELHERIATLEDQLLSDVQTSQAESVSQSKSWGRTAHGRLIRTGGRALLAFGWIPGPDDTFLGSRGDQFT